MPNVQTFKATAQLQEGVKVVTKARQFELVIDEPQSLGGTDTGMNPVEALLASLVHANRLWPAFMRRNSMWCSKISG